MVFFPVVLCTHNIFFSRGKKLEDYIKALQNICFRNETYFININTLKLEIV